jgi:polyketide cyclase/dehydrase/lipid transport protein
MKPLKKVLLVILLIPVVLVIISFFLPSSYSVRRSVSIQAKPETVFALINSLKRWPEWSAWTVARYPDMKTTYSGPDAGTGSAMAWEGKASGNGSMKITSSDPAKGITYDLDFEHGRYLSKGDLTFQPSGDSLTLTWINSGNLGWNPVSRLFGLLMDKMMGGDMETGLKNLQKAAEGK